jgi:hypothetical protein
MMRAVGVKQLEAHLSKLAAAGEVERSVAEGRFAWKPRGLGLPRGTAKSILDAVRDDR